MISPRSPGSAANKSEVLLSQGQSRTRGREKTKLPSVLFSPFKLREFELQNRVVVAPMTQFSTDDGVAGDWHLMHLGTLGVSGAGLVITESTYVSPEARNTQNCLALYSDEQEAGIARVAGFIKRYGGAKFGVQLCHAGRKASAKEPWRGGGPLPLADGGYETFAPSPIPVGDGWHVPTELTAADIEKICDAFAASARRADRADVDLIEIHSAHGYLLHQFLSPLSNRRADDYGGSLENRMRFPLAVFDAVRKVWPQHKPVGVRVSATDWVEGGWDLEQTIEYARVLEKRGCDHFHVSSGGLSPAQKITVGPGYQVPFAAAVKAAVKMPVIAVGQISDAIQAETIVATGQADMVALARVMLYQPRWAWEAAVELGEEVFYPRQYVRGHPSRWGARGVTSPGNRIPKSDAG
jgi:2,4-dienoyl-CoA reductase-like NADH-dependent reductase (Old Yellow Enzyme family)